MRVTTDDVNYHDIADAIRYVLGVETEYLPSEMAPAIRSFADLIGRDVTASAAGSSARVVGKVDLDMDA